AEGDVHELGRRVEGLAVQSDDEVPDLLTTLHLVTRLHRGPHDVVGEERGEVASIQQSVQVLTDGAFGFFERHVCSFRARSRLAAATGLGSWERAPGSGPCIKSTPALGDRPWSSLHLRATSQ